jgi:hypothetical protein
MGQSGQLSSLLSDNSTRASRRKVKRLFNSPNLHSVVAKENFLTLLPLLVGGPS